ncbi:intermembrane phospholipid transport protein YdbH family protein [Microbulbifer sp. SA54]|uniref:intermembrane phospholipid transport protein YdbH family protein n=1 Tax=Microbulbifer sp. SA54 TaxID=3401577 RepID=UPI003AAC3024
MPKFSPNLTTTRVIAIGLLLALVFGGVYGWQSRHQWLPALANNWLGPVEIRKVEQFELTDWGKSITIARLRIAFPGGRELELRNLRLTDWFALAGNSGVKESKRGAKLVIDQANVSAQARTSGNTSSPRDNSERRQEPGTSAGQGANPTNRRVKTKNEEQQPLLLSQTLQRLKSLGLQQIDVQSIEWPDMAPGAFTLNLTRRGNEFDGQLSHSQCSGCRLSAALASTQDQTKLHIRATDDNQQAFAAELRFTPPGPDDSQNQKYWQMAGNLRAALENTEKMARKIGLNALAALPESPASGNLLLQLQGELPDSVLTLDGYRKFVANLEADHLQWALPPINPYIAVPLKITANSTLPLTMELASVTPLQFASATGKLAVTVDTVVQGTETDWITADIALGSTGNQDIAVNGAVNLSRINQLVSRDWMQTLLAGYQLEKFTGELKLTGTAKLPPLENLSNLQDLVLNDIRLQIQPGSTLATHVSPPGADNPLTRIGWPNAAIQLTLNEIATLTAPSWPAPLKLELTSLAVHSQPSAPAGKKASDNTLPKLAGTIKELTCSDLVQSKCSLQFVANLSTLKIKEADFEAREITLESSISNLTDKDGKQNNASNIQLSTFNAAADFLKIGEVAIEKPEIFSQSVNCSLDKTDPVCRSDQIALSLAPLAVPDATIAGAVFFEKIAVSKQAKGIHAKANYRSDSLTVSGLGPYRATLDTTGSLQLGENQVRGTSHVSSGGMKIETTWEHNLERSAGELRFKVPEASFNPQSPLSQSVQGLPVDIVDGKLTATGTIYWPNENTKTGRANRIYAALDSVGISFGDIFAVGIDSEISLTQSGEYWVTPESKRVKIQKLDAGLPLENLNFRLRLTESGDLTLTEFSGEMLQGALTSEVLTWNLNGAQRHSLVSFTGLSLAALAKEMDAENFVATGLLDAKMPITVDKQGVTIENGTLSARPPGGRLRYYGAFSPSMLTSNPQLKLIAGALEDYNYRDMRGTITYPLSGDLKLNLKLTGRSSAVDANRDLIINLNLENNVPSMLKSLQASRDLTDVLEKSMQ